ncbi:MAG TPA: hypothetical protein VIP77_03430 [Jiangellaceae bacterium]
MNDNAVARRTDPTDTGLLGVYLNDHLAGATAGLELARRMARTHRATPVGAALDALAHDLESEREALLEIMERLDVPVRHYKVYGAWVLERLGRVKLNGRLLSRSPLSSLLEFEVLRLGVEGKAALWRTIWHLTAHRDDSTTTRLAALITAAREQAELLEKLRMRAVDDAFVSGSASTGRGTAPHL